MYPWHCASAHVASEPKRQFSQFKHESASHCIQRLGSAKWDAGLDPTSFRAGIPKRTGQEAHLDSDSIADLDSGVRAVPDCNNISSSVLSCKRGVSG